MEQPSVFENDFPAPVRRKDLLPFMAKLYAWLSAIYGCLNLIAIIINRSPFFDDHRSYTNEQTTGSVLFSLLVMALGIPILLEKKAAIQLNFILTCYVLGTTVHHLLYGRFVISWIIILIIFTPYWLMLRKIQPKWEKEATGRK